MKILVDMNLSPSWVGFFAANSLEARHWSDVGNPNDPDSRLLEYAMANDFVIFTHDLDFGSLLVRGSAHGPSVIQVRAQDVLPAAIGLHVLAAIRAAAREIETGALVTVDPSQHRVRVLPI